MNDCNNLFSYYDIHKLREVLKEDNDKKFEKKNPKGNNNGKK
jgi:hypothetical protein